MQLLAYRVASDSPGVIAEPLLLPLKQRRLYLLATAMIIASFALLRGFSLPESDLLWEIRTGNVFLSSGTIPRVESWAWLIEGRDWLPNSWAWNVLVALVYNAGGMLGLGVLNFALFCLTFTLMATFLHLLRLGRPARFSVLVVTAFLSITWMTLRPQYADYALLLGWMNIAALSWRFSGHARLTALPPLAFALAALWMNLHLSAAPAVALFPAAYLFCGAFLRGEAKRSMAVTSLLIAFGAALALLTTPFGIEGITKGGAVLRESRGLIAEWDAIDLAHGYGWFTLIGVIVCGLLPVGLGIWRRQWLLAATMLGFCIVSAEIVRFSPLLILFSALAAPLLPKRFTRAEIHSAATYLFSCALVLVLGISFALPRILEPERITLLNPADLRVIPQHSRVLTMAQGGGTVLLYRPDSSPSLDSRNDIYGKDLYLKVASLFYSADRPTVQGFLDGQRVNAVYVETSLVNRQPETITPIMAQLGWVKHRFDDATIWVRPGA